MPNTFTPSAVALTTITEPVDGEARTAASVTTMTRALADAIAFEKARLNPLADLTALAAITTPADGLVRHVLGFGWYVFKTSATTGLSPFRVAAGDATAGGWVSSTAHQTALTRYALGGRIRGGTSSAVSPSISATMGRVIDANLTLSGMGSAIVQAASTDVTDAWGFFLPIDDVLVDGATIATATLRYTPDDSSAPATFIQFAVCRSQRTGFGFTNVSLKSGSAFVADSGSYASGVDKDVVLTADQNNVIDLSTYSYGVIIFDEHGASGSAGNAIHHVAIGMTSIPDARR